MRRILMVLVMLLLAGGITGTTVAAEQLAAAQKFSLELTTKSAAPMFTLPPGLNYPGHGNPSMADRTRPTRTISGEADYDSPPAPPIFVTVPADLMLPQDQLILAL